MKALVTNLIMKLVAFIYLCVAITLLVPNLVGGQELTERGKTDSNERQQEGWMRWQSWYLNSVASYDFLSDQEIYSTRNPDSHGTKCAGIIAGGNNSKCGVGIAFGAQISI